MRFAKPREVTIVTNLPRLLPEKHGVVTTGKHAPHASYDREVQSGRHGKTRLGLRYGHLVVLSFFLGGTTHADSRCTSRGYRGTVLPLSLIT